MISEPRVKQLDIEGSTQAIDWLMYRSYEFNRDRSPDIAPERWRQIYYNQEVYEKIYQERGTHVSSSNV